MNLKMCKSNEISFLSTILNHQKRHVLSIVGFLFIIAILNALLPQLSAAIIDDGFIEKNTKIIFLNSIFVFGLNAMMTLIYVLVEKLRLQGYNSIQTTLKEKAILKLNTVKIVFFNEQSATAIFQQLDEDINAISGCFSSEILLSLAQIAISFVLLPVLFNISWKLTVILLIAIPINLFKTIFVSRIGYRLSRDKVQAKKDYSQWISEIISGTKIIRCLVPLEYIRTSFIDKQNKVINTQYKHLLFQEITVRLEGLFVECLLTLFYIFGGYYVVRNEITLGQFIAFQTYSLTILNIIGDFLNVIYGYSTIKPSIERYIEFDKEDDENIGTYSVKNPKETLLINNITFNYGKGENIINKLNLTIPYGKKIGVHGGNGSGKTTFINLLLRFYMPSSGTILLGSENINRFNVEEYRRLFSFVPQQPFLFCDSLRNNITLFRNINERELMNAVEMVGLGELIDKKTLDFCVGQNGCELSGGQRQRISIARTLISKSCFIVLDEPESNLDSDFKQILKKIIDECYRNKTVIMISHDHELLECMDIIYEMGKGENEDSGN